MLDSQTAEEDQRGSADQRIVIKKASKLEKMGIAVVINMYRLLANHLFLHWKMVIFFVMICQFICIYIFLHLTKHEGSHTFNIYLIYIINIV